MLILDSISVLSIKQNPKNVNENYLKCDYLQSGWSPLVEEILGEGNTLNDFQKAYPQNCKSYTVVSREISMTNLIYFINI